MELSQNRTVKIIAIFLFLSAISQPIYTALYIGAPELNRKFLWALEGPLFVLLCAFSGSALVMAKRHSLGFSAIAFSAVLNVAQVGIGFLQFGPFREVAKLNTELAAISFSFVALSFFLYNGAKILLGLAAVVFGMAKRNEGSQALGTLTIVVGAFAIIANILVMIFGIKSFLPSPIAGGSGVLATLFLAICLFRYKNEY